MYITLRIEYIHKLSIISHRCFTYITLFIPITMFYGTHNIPWYIPRIQTKCGKYGKILHEIVSVPQNIVMELNNVMYVTTIEVRKSPPSITVYVWLYLLQLNPFRIFSFLHTCSLSHMLKHKTVDFELRVVPSWVGCYDKLIGFYLIHFGSITWCISRLGGGSFEFVYLHVVIRTWLI